MLKPCVLIPELFSWFVFAWYILIDGMLDFEMLDAIKLFDFQ